MSTTEMAFQMARVRREHTRWFLLTALNVARPAGAPTQVLLSIVQSVYSDATEMEVRRELDYLADRELVAVDKRPTNVWHCELTRFGVDVAEYTVPVEPGIARPTYSGG